MRQRCRRSLLLLRTRQRQNEGRLELLAVAIRLLGHDCSLVLRLDVPLLLSGFALGEEFYVAFCLFWAYWVARVCFRDLPATVNVFFCWCSCKLLVELFWVLLLDGPCLKISFILLLEIVLLLFKRIWIVYLRRIGLLNLSVLQRLVGVPHVTLPLLELTVYYRHTLISLLLLPLATGTEYLRLGTWV